MKMKKIVAVLLTAAMAVVPINSMAYVTGETTWTTDQTSLLKLCDTASITTFNYLSKGLSHTIKVQANFFDPLVLIDSDNTYIPGIAESWETNEDDSVWTFHLRDTATWVDYQGNYKADVVADDFLYSLEWTLNYWKNNGVNTSTPCSMIKGAQDYYEYTQSLTEEEGLAITDLDKFREMVEIDEPDEYTLVYNLTGPVVYFTSVISGNAFWPLSGSLIDEIGVDGFMTATYDTIWYCGPYTMSNFVDGNIEVYTKNESYWNLDDTLLYDEVRISIVESDDIAYEMYMQGDNDRVSVNASYVSLLEGTDMFDHIVRRKETGVVFYLIFNYDKQNEDGTPDEDWNKAAANEAFRKCFYYGCDFTNYVTYKDSIDPLSQIIMTISPYGSVKFSDGSDYTDRVLELIGLDREQETYPHMDADLVEQYKAEAMEELEAEGVTFPINIDMWCSSSQEDQDLYTITKELIENGLGTDFVTVTINTYVSSALEEYIYPGYYSLAMDGNGIEYNDPYSMVGALDLNDDDADLVNMYGMPMNNDSEELKAVFEELTDMIEEADAIIDLDERYEAFAQVEAYAIEHVLVIPTNGNRSLVLTNYNEYSGVPPMSESLGVRYEGLEYKEGGYTTEDYDLYERKYLGLE